MAEVKSRFLFRMEATLHPLQEVGGTPLGHRRIAPVAGGTIDGPRLRGSILPHAGGDWLLVRPDGSLLLDVRITLKTDDGALILMTYRGVRQGPPEALARLARGEHVDPSEYYFRSAPFFETGAARYAWLNDIVSVGIGERLPSAVRYDVFEIL